MEFFPTRMMGGGIGGGASWDPSSPTSDGGVSPHTWHYAGSDGLYQDSGKTTVADADGDPVGASANQGSDSHDITQATSANKPTLKLDVLNGEPVFRLDGGDYLQGAFNGAWSQPVTIFVVAKLDAAVTNDNLRHTLIDSDDATNRAMLFTYQTPSPDEWAIYAGGQFSGSSVDSNWNIWTVLFNGASSQFWHNGVSENSGDAGTDDADGLTMASRYSKENYWDGDIAEILIYDSNLSNADKNEIGQYLASKYSLSYTDIT